VEISAQNSARVATVEATQVAAAPWTGREGDIDLVRVVDPPRSQWAALRSAGFLPRPARLVWPADLGATEDEMLAGVTSKRRRELNRARRQVDRTGIRQVPEVPITPALLDAFLVLYAAQIDQMRHGTPYAVRMRDKLLADLDAYFGVFAYDGGELVGGCVCHEDRDALVTRIRFSAVADRYRRLSLGKVLYFTAMEIARERGHKQATLGMDGNPYGVTAEPGLFRFKAGLGFTAVPSQDFHDAEGTDVADLVLSLGALADPSFVVAYADDHSRRLTGVVLSATTDVDLAPFQAPFLSDVSLRTIAERA
jgi:GNAT superfamily N-acetyltransferase